MHLSGAAHCARAAVGHLQQECGRIVFISSTAGQRGEAFHSHYGASKSGLIGLTKSLGPELAPKGIRVNCVAPGWVDTDMTLEYREGPRRERVTTQIPLGTFAAPADIAQAVLFLASPMASHITGEVLNVNGGSVLCG